MACYTNAGFEFEYTVYNYYQVELDAFRQCCAIYSTSRFANPLLIKWLVRQATNPTTPAQAHTSAFPLNHGLCFASGRTLGANELRKFSEVVTRTNVHTHGLYSSPIDSEDGRQTFISGSDFYVVFFLRTKIGRQYNITHGHVLFILREERLITYLRSEELSLQYSLFVYVCIICLYAVFYHYQVLFFSLKNKKQKSNFCYFCMEVGTD